MTDTPGTGLRRWSDEAMFEAAPMKAHGDTGTGVLPKVTLLWMTPDPLGAIAAACRMYEGKPTYDLDDITDEERKHYWQQVQKTHLKAPLEFVKFHFFIEGVDRAFTHQMVRQRTAVYAQESMRFAVKDNILDESTLPPSLAGTDRLSPSERGASGKTSKQRQREIWDETMEQIQSAYTVLVENGMPAEEARGLMPHAVATRLNYATDLRALMDHAGNRLCTQAQFVWRLVFSQIAQAIKQYPPKWDDNADRWQVQRLSSVFKPVCYELGHCPFQASFDRHCSIRERVEKNSARGRPSSEWHLPLLDESVGREWVKVSNADCPVQSHAYDEGGWRPGMESGAGPEGWHEHLTTSDAEPIIEPIYDTEWALDDTAARRA